MKSSRGGSVQNATQLEVYLFVFIFLINFFFYHGKVLDKTPPLENHKIGVLYVREGQKLQTEILANRIGSPRYNSFLSGLGTLVSLKKASKGFYLPGLSDKGDDGDECYVWQDEIMQVSLSSTVRSLMFCCSYIDPL